MSNNEENTTNLTVSQAWNLWKTAQRAVLEAERTADEALRTVGRAAGSKTFMYDGQLYQLRERKNKERGEKVPYLCELSRPPGEAIREAREKAYAEAESASKASEGDSMPTEAGTVSETVQAAQEQAEVPSSEQPSEDAQSTDPSFLVTMVVDTEDSELEDIMSGTVSASDMFDEAESDPATMVLD